MDLNELLYAHQVEVMKLGGAGNGANLDSHFAKVTQYAQAIRNLRMTGAAIETEQDPAAPPTIIYGSYAGPSSSAAPGDDAILNSVEPGAANENPDRGQANP